MNDIVTVVIAAVTGALMFAMAYGIAQLVAPYI